MNNNDFNIVEYNRAAWDREVGKGNPWTIPVTREVIAQARQGNWNILLTPTIPVPREWFGELCNKEVLCLASGGGQQGPVLVAAGAQVTVLDNSPAQLAKDRLVAEREDLQLITIQGDMMDLGMFPDEQFDLIFHPISNTFVPDVVKVWKEAFRVLKHGGSLLAGFTNPTIYIFDTDSLERGIFEVRNPLPYSDIESLDKETLQYRLNTGRPMEFSHTLNAQIGGQIAAGFIITGFYEDRDPIDPISKYFPGYIATLSMKR
jgi:ubiquinone/menaquinone biosynthesis C-methylase UbiE